MNTRSRVVRIVAVVVALTVVVLGAWGLTQGAGMTASMIFVVGLIGLGVTAFVIGRKRRSWAPAVAGMAGAVVCGGLAVLALGIRSLCWANPDAAAAQACGTLWLAGAVVLGVLGVVSLVAGIRVSGWAHPGLR